MRWDAGTLRVVCLVASAVSAGYLWRAALEGDAELGLLLDTSPPAEVDVAPAWDDALVSPELARVDRARAEPRRTAEPTRPQVRKRAKPVVRPRGARPSRPAPSRAEPAAVPAPTKSGGKPKMSGKPTGVPKKPGKATAKPPTGGGSPRGGPTARPEPAPESAAPKPKPKPKPAPKPEPEAKPEPKSQPQPQPEPQPEPTTEPPVAPAAVEQRPGWGRGDRNHEHAGPPGKGKRKK